MLDPSIPASGGGYRPSLGDVVMDDFAEYLSGEDDQRAAVCRDAVLSGRGLHHVAHYVNGVYEFAVDVLADPALAGEVAGAGLDRKRAACLQTGRELSYNMVRVDHSLREVQSGALIRAVFQSAKGAIFCGRVIPREYIVALVLDGSAATRPELPLTQFATVRDADRAVAELVTTLRDELSLGSQNPGGWSSPKPASDAAGTAGPDTSRPPALEITGRIDHPLSEAYRAALNTADLHYVAHFHDDDVEFSADCLEDRTLSRFFLHISGSARRKFYADLGRQFTVLARQFFQVVCPVIGGPVSRIVLDVEQGAIYFYRLTSEDYLVGVTLDQRRVSQADDKMAQLAIQSRDALGSQ